MLHGWNPQGFSMYLVPRNMYMVQYFSIIFFLSVVSALPSEYSGTKTGSETKKCNGMLT